MPGPNGEDIPAHPQDGTPGAAIELDCAAPGCGQKFMVHNPPAEIVNRATFSAVVVPHPEPVCCPNCGQAYQWGMAAAQWRSSWMPVKTKQTPSIVVPPPGFRVPS